MWEIKKSVYGKKKIVKAIENYDINPKLSEFAYFLNQNLQP